MSGGGAPVEPAAASAGAEGQNRCPYCGSGTAEDRGRMTLWLGERLVVLEDLPARACRGCGETFYPPEIVARIERIQTGGAREAAPVRTLEVPVYSWEDL